MKPLLVSFNGDSVIYVAHLQDITGLERYLVDGESRTVEYVRENFTIISEA